MRTQTLTSVRDSASSTILGFIGRIQKTFREYIQMISQPSSFAAQNYSVSDGGLSRRQLKLNKFFKNSFFLPIAVVVILVVILAIFSLKNLGKVSTSVLSENDRYELPSAEASQDLNKLYNFPLRDSSWKEVSKLQYLITDAEIRDEIIVKGQRNKTFKGRTFLILNMKITNSYDKAVSINSRDYVRLTVNDSSEKLASSVHNDPVEVDPISTKYTRLGFAINESDKNLTLQIGEIKGKKDTVKLTIK